MNPAAGCVSVGGGLNLPPEGEGENKSALLREAILNYICAK